MKMPIEPIRYGIVGLGRAGWEIHAGELRKRSDARIVAVADTLADRRQQAAQEFGCAEYPSLDPMLTQRDVEVIVIATPSVTHAQDTLRSLRAGKHVIVEKPMAMNVAEADRMIDASKKADRRLFVHQNYRYFREFTHLRQIIESGILGRLFHIRTCVTGFSRRNDWQTLAKNGGGVLNNTCPHYVDQILQLVGGRIVQVMGDLQQIASAGDVEDHVKAFMRADNGCTVDLEISNAQNLRCSPSKWVLCGTCGTLQSDGSTSTIRWFDPKLAPPLSAIDGAAADRRYANGDQLPWQETTVPAVGPDDGCFYDNVSAVIRRGTPMHITPASVREVLRVIAMIRDGTRFPGLQEKDEPNDPTTVRERPHVLCQLRRTPAQRVQPEHDAARPSPSLE